MFQGLEGMLDRAVLLSKSTGLEIIWEELIMRSALAVHDFALVVFQVRQLCKRQFNLRMLGKKIANRQAESPTPARVGSGPGVPMPHGDSWVNSGMLMNPLVSQSAH